MTEAEAITVAEKKALELNLPWSREAITARHWRVWPFAGVWRIVTVVRSEGAIVTMVVPERTGRAMPRQVSYPVGGLQ